MIWIILGSIALLIIAFFVYHVLKYRNNFRLIFLFGKKGCGKSSTLCKLAFKYIRRGWTVYSTEPIPGTRQIPPEAIGFYEMEPKSVVLIDEVGLIWHSRDFKTFPKEVRSWFKLQRHRKLRVYMCSQSFDVDKSVRDLCDEMWLLTNFANCISYQKRIVKKFAVVEASGESESRIVENLKIDSLLLAPFGSRRFVWIPRYAKYFDSFAVDPLLPRNYEARAVTDPKLRRYLRLDRRPRRFSLTVIKTRLRNGGARYKRSRRGKSKA